MRVFAKSAVPSSTWPGQKSDTVVQQSRTSLVGVRKSVYMLRLWACYEHLGNPEIAEDKSAVPQEEDVLRFEIPMKNEAAVHKVETEGNLHEPVKDLALGEQLPPVTGVEDGGLIEPRRHFLVVVSRF